jgi:T5SS/PEP-CTERM-associated repeat protein
VRDLGSQVNIFNDWIMGWTGGFGTALISDGGSLEATHSAFLGDCEVTITGKKSSAQVQWFNLGMNGHSALMSIDDEGTVIATGGAHIGGSGDGTLTMNGGSSFTTYAATIANGAGISGIADVSGQDTSFTGLVTVGGGSGSLGILTVSDGATVSSRRPDGSFHLTYLGLNDDAVGDVLVTGPGSTWHEIDWLTVGGVFHTDTTGRGFLRVEDGGTVSSLRGILGIRSSSAGFVTIDGRRLDEGEIGGGGRIRTHGANPLLFSRQVL